MIGNTGSRRSRAARLSKDRPGATPADPRLVLPPEDETKFSWAVYEYATVRRWLGYHTFDSRKSPSGFPDWTFVRGERLVFAELKVGSNTLEGAQKEWRERLLRVAYIEYFLWYPQDWPQIVRVLE